MAFRKHVMITVALLSISGLLLGCSSDSTVTPTPIPTTEAPLIAPWSVTAMRTANGDIRLTWTPNTQAHLKGYNIYRGSLADNEIDLLTVDPIATNSYLDTDVEDGVRYQYMISAISVKNAESGFATASACVGCDSNRQRPLRKRE
jgi:hypothetical protein